MDILKEIAVNASKPSSSARQRVLVLSTLAALVLAACDKAPEPPAAAPAPAPDAQVAAQPVPSQAPVARAPTTPTRSAAPAPAPQEVVQPYYERPQAVYTQYRAPLSQPAPIAVPWAPPAMLVESIPPQPSPDSNWTGGYWVWHEGWVWAPGYWATPPRPRYHWVPPYYEHRDDRVVFVDGFWSPPGVGFVRPAAGVTIALAVIGAAFAVGHPPVGPEGVFVPPPPGSRPGLLVPAPIGTAPAVVVRAPAIIAPGMRVSTVVNNVDNSVRNNVRNTTINNNRNTTVVNNITNVTIEAPASATANHEAVRVNVPSQPHLAAAMAAHEGAPQPAVNAPQVPPPRTAEAARQAMPSHVDENAMKRPLPVSRSMPAATPTAPQMHTEQATRSMPAPEQRRPAESAPVRSAEQPAPHAARPAAPEARPATPPPQHAAPAHAPAPAPHPAQPSPQAARAEPAHTPAPPAHAAAEKPKQNETARKPGGEPRDENGRKDREPR